jgi:hypothetical protein
MATPTLRLKRSNVAHRRPSPSNLSTGEIVVNYHASTPGLFFKDHTGNLVKSGPAHVSLPEDSVASPTLGELWFDMEEQMLKVWVGIEWKPAVPAPVADPQPRVQVITFTNTDGSTTQFVG